MNLRPYQQQAITLLRLKMQQGFRRIILCSPTGSGKTVMFSTMAQRAIAKGKRVLIVTDRIELMRQSQGALGMLNLDAQTIEAGKQHTDDAALYVGMVETIDRRLKNKPDFEAFFRSFDLYIFDEAHKQAFNKLFDYIDDTKFVIGATATPYRQGTQMSLMEHYAEIVESVSISQLIADGYLSTPKSYGVPTDLSKVKMKAGEYDGTSLGQAFSKNRVFDGVIENYTKLTPKQKAIAFCPSIESSIELCQEMRSEGLNAVHLDSTMSADKRAQVLAAFKAQPDAILCNVGILTTGFDAPDIQVIILYRATTSLPLFLQMVGRGSRVTPTKKQFTILDFGNNIQRHGFWEDDRVWSLEKAEKKVTTGPPACKNCPECNALLLSMVRECDCGHVFNLKKEQEDREFAELKLMEKKLIMAKARKLTLEQLAQLVELKKINPYWVLHKMTSFQEAVQFTELLHWKPGWWKVNAHRFPNLR